MVSIEAYAGLQLHKPHSQSGCGLAGVLLKKFTSTPILFDVKYGICIAVLVIFQSSRLSVAPGHPDCYLFANDPITTYCK